MDVIILGNSNLRLKSYKYINSLNTEIWVCNAAYKEFNKFKRIDRVGTVHGFMALKALQYKKKYNLKYNIYCSKITSKADIKPFSKYRGWSTGSTLIESALIENYKNIYICGFGCLYGNKSDIYMGEVVISNFIKQINSLREIYHFKIQNTKYKYIQKIILKDQL